MTLHHAMLFLHVAGVVVWVGGMAFAYFCLRPAAMRLAPAPRLALWRDVLARFFPIVGVAIVLILASGFRMLLEVGFARAPGAWHAMAGLGIAMSVIFATLVAGPWPRLKAAVAAEDWAAGALALAAIRQRVGINLVLGAITIALATLGLAY